jgi:hypothetical protein
VELYNLKDDLSEKTDLVTANAKKATELRGKLNAWRVAVGAQLPTKNPAYDPAKEWDSERPAEKKATKAKKK